MLHAQHEPLWTVILFQRRRNSYQSQLSRNRERIKSYVAETHKSETREFQACIPSNDPIHSFDPRRSILAPKLRENFILGSFGFSVCKTETRYPTGQGTTMC